LREEARAHRSYLVEYEVDFPLLNQWSAYIPEEAQLAPIYVLAIAGKLAHRHVITLRRPTPPVVVRVLKDIMPQRVHAMKDSAVGSLDLPNVIGVVVVQAIYAARGDLEEHCIRGLGAVSGFHRHRGLPGSPVVRTAQAYDMLAALPLHAPSGGHGTQPGAVIRLHHVGLIGISLGGDIQAVVEMPGIGHSHNTPSPIKTGKR
jgi:hypothetical protein